MKHFFRSLSIAFYLIMSLCLLSALFLTAGPARAQANSRYFPETRHTVNDQFLQYWVQHGGLAIFGYPLTDPVPEFDPATGKSYLTQWFERNVFQYHPEFAGTPYEVELGLLGRTVVQQNQASIGAAYNPAADAHYPGGTFYPETGHNLQGAFKNYWDQHGGLAIFGFPLTEEFLEVNPDDGHTYMVQYFERNRFEYHPDLKGTLYEVELGLLGKQLLNTRRVTGSLNLSTVAYLKPVTGMTVDSQDNLYVANSQRNDIEKFDASGKVIARIGGSGAEDGQFSYPAGLAVGQGGKLYVADTYNNRIQVFDSNGKFLFKWGKSGTSGGSFTHPQGVAIDSQGNVYVTDTGNSRVQKFSSDGTFLAKWGNQGSGEGQFGPAIHGLNLHGPNYIAVDKHDNVYISDDGNNRVEKFDSSGHFLYQLEAQYPGGLAVDNQGRLYVALQRQLLEYDQNGKLILKMGEPTSPDALLNGISALAVNGGGSVIYIAETSLGAVFKLPQG